MKDMWDKEYKANHPEADANKSINSPKVQLDPMSLVGKTNFTNYNIPKFVDPSSNYYARLGEYGKKMAAEENYKMLSKGFSRIGMPGWKEQKLSSYDQNTNTYFGLPMMMNFATPLDKTIGKLRYK